MMFKQFLDREKTMKRIIMLAMVLVMLLISIGGCWVPYEDGGRDGRHNRDGRYDRDADHRGPEGGGPGGGGHGSGGPGGGH